MYMKRRRMLEKSSLFFVTQQCDPSDDAMQANWII